MTATWIKYSADIVAPEPDFDANQAKIVERINEYETISIKSEGTNTAVRFAHAKGYGLVKGHFEVLPNLATEYAQGIYGKPAVYPAVVRYSNGLAHLGSDASLGPVAGMALKLFGVPGRKMLDDEPGSLNMDFNMINGPIFFCNTVRHYLFLEEIFIDIPKYLSRGKAGRNEMFRDWVTGKGNLAPEEWAWDELGAFLRLGLGAHWQNLLLTSFWSMGAVRHGDYVAKLRIRPTDQAAALVKRRQLDPGAEAEVFRPALVEELRERQYEFDFQVQLCADLDAMPLDDLTVEWPEKLSPFVTVARLTFDRQDIGHESNLKSAEGVSMTPWRCPEEHQPLGSIQRLRKQVYQQSSVHRHKLNGMKREEPSSPDELFR